MSTNLVVASPTVKVAGKTYSVRYSHGAIYLLSTWGIDLTRIFTTLAEALGVPYQPYIPATGDKPEILERAEIVPNGRRTELMMKIAAASLGTIDAEGNWRSAQISPMDLADRMSDDEAEVIDRVTWEAFAKKIGLPLPNPVTPVAQNPPDTTKPSGSDSGPSEPAEPV